MDQLLEKSLSQDSEGERDCKNKWRSYRIGRHTPSTKLVELIDAVYPGSQAALNHVFWKTLRLDRPIATHADSWLNELHPDIQGIIFQRSAALSIGKTPSSTLNQTHLSMLERRAGLDALACLVIYLRKIAEEGDTYFAHRLGWHLCRLLLILGPMLSVTGIVRPLIQYIEQEILPISSHNGLHYRFLDKGYLSTARRLDLTAHAIEGNENRHFSISERIALRIHLLNSGYIDFLGDAPPHSWGPSLLSHNGK